MLDVQLIIYSYTYGPTAKLMLTEKTKEGMGGKDNDPEKMNASKVAYNTIAWSKHDLAACEPVTVFAYGLGH